MVYIKTMAILGYPLTFLQLEIEGGGDDPLATNSMGGRFAWMKLGKNGVGYDIRIYHCGLHKLLRHLEPHGNVEECE